MARCERSEYDDSNWCVEDMYLQGLLQLFHTESLGRKLVRDAWYGITEEMPGMQKGEKKWETKKLENT